MTRAEPTGKIPSWTKEGGRGNSMTAVVINGFSDQGKIDAAMREGVMDCMKKPFNVSEIRAVIQKKILAGKGEWVKVLAVDDDPAMRSLFKRLEG